MRLLLFIPVILISCQSKQSQNSEKIRFYTGTTDGSIENSITLCELNLTDGHLSLVDSFSGARSPSYLALSPDRQFLYAVDEEYTDQGWESQQVSAFELNNKTGSLRFLNSQPSEGTGPCHISIHPGGKFIFTANYNSGTIAVHPLNEDGSIAPATYVRQHEGSISSAPIPMAGSF